MFQNTWEKKNRYPTIHFVGQFFDLMLGRVSPKYLDNGSPVVFVHIDGIMVPNTMIDLGAVINVMTRETILNLNLQGGLRKTTIILCNNPHENSM